MMIREMRFFRPLAMPAASQPREELLRPRDPAERRNTTVSLPEHACDGGPATTGRSIPTDGVPLQLGLTFRGWPSLARLFMPHRFAQVSGRQQTIAPVLTINNTTSTSRYELAVLKSVIEHVNLARAGVLRRPAPPALPASYRFRRHVHRHAGFACDQQRLISKSSGFPPDSHPRGAIALPSIPARQNIHRLSPA